MIAVDLSLQASALNDVIAAKLPQVLLKENNFQDRGIGLVVQQAAPPKITFSDRVPEKFKGFAASTIVVNLELPLKIDISKNIVLTTATANGEIILNLAIAIHISPRWDVDAETELIGFQWLKQPQLSVAGFKIGAERIATSVVERSRQRINQQLEAELESKLNLKQLIAQLSDRQKLGWSLPAEAPNGQVYPHISQLGFQIISAEQEVINLRVGAEASPVLMLQEAVISNLAADTDVSLERITEFPGQFDQSIVVALSASTLQLVLAKALHNKRFEKWGQEVSIVDSTVRMASRHFTIGLGLAGVINGEVEVSGTPVLDADSGLVKLHSPDVDIETQSGLLNLFANALKSRLAKEINEQLGTQIAAGLVRARTETNAKIEALEVAEGVLVKGRVASLVLTQVVQKSSALELSLRATGRLSANLDKLPPPPAA